MNLPIRHLLIAGLFFICITGFTDRMETTIANAPFLAAALSAPVEPPARPKPLKMATLIRPNQGTLYYWFSQPYDTYNDRKTLNDEIWELWFYYAALVDTDPGGGILVSKGYFTSAVPHNQFPYYFLYVHYVYE